MSQSRRKEEEQEKKRKKQMPILMTEGSLPKAFWSSLLFRSPVQMKERHQGHFNSLIKDVSGHYQTSLNIPEKLSGLGTLFKQLSLSWQWPSASLNV